MNFNSILIGSSDPEQLAAYYTKLFGEPRWNDGEAPPRTMTCCRLAWRSVKNCITFSRSW